MRLLVLLVLVVLLVFLLLKGPPVLPNASHRADAPLPPAPGAWCARGALAVGRSARAGVSNTCELSKACVCGGANKEGVAAAAVVADVVLELVVVAVVVVLELVAVCISNGKAAVALSCV